MRVLAVDDNELNLKLISEALSSRGHTVSTVRDPSRAIAEAEAFGPHVVLLDIAMPGTDGIELMRRFRDHPRLGAVPIYALTAHDDVEMKGLTQGGGFTEVLRKPCSIGRLLDLVGQADNARPTAAR